MCSWNAAGEVVVFDGAVETALGHRHGNAVTMMKTERPRGRWRRCCVRRGSSFVAVARRRMDLVTGISGGEKETAHFRRREQRDMSQAGFEMATACSGMETFCWSRRINSKAGMRALQHDLVRTSGL